MKNQIAEIVYGYGLTPMQAEKCADDLFSLFVNMHSSLQGANQYEIVHLINDTYQVVDKLDDTCYKQGTKAECERYLFG